MIKINKVLLELYKDKNQILFLGFLACMDLIISNFIPSNTNVYQCVFGLTAGAAAGIGLAISAIGTAYSIYNAGENRAAAQDAADDAEKRRLAEQEKLDVARKKYEKLQFDNPYEDIENPYEDLTVNQQQAQFQAQQVSQQSADILQNLRGAAGMSGIAGLAQSLANKQQLATQKISADIGKQEALNQKLAAKGAMEVEKLEGYGRKLQQDFEMQKQSTLFGMSIGDAAAANQAYQNALANQQQISAAADAQIAGSLVGLGQAGLNYATNMENIDTGKIDAYSKEYLESISSSGRDYLLGDTGGY